MLQIVKKSEQESDAEDGRSAIRDLLVRREILTADIEGRHCALNDLAALEEAEAATVVEIHGIEAREAEDIRQWAATGAKGAAPDLRTKEREALSERMQVARAKANAARSAAASISAEIVDLTKQRDTLDEEIEAAVVEIVAAEVEPMFAEVAEIGAKFVEASSRLQMAAEPLIDLAHRRNRRRPDSGRDLLLWVEKFHARVRDTKPTAPTPEDLARATEGWRQFISEATDGVVTGRML